VHSRRLEICDIPVSTIIVLTRVLERRKMRLNARGRRAEPERSAAAKLGSVGGNLIVFSDDGRDLVLMGQKFLAREIAILSDVANNSRQQRRHENDHYNRDSNLPVRHQKRNNDEHAEQDVWQLRTSRSDARRIMLRRQIPAHRFLDGRLQTPQPAAN
jgi:hypothetical protein